MTRRVTSAARFEQLGQLAVVDGWPGAVVQHPRPDTVNQEDAELLAHRGEGIEQFPVALVDQRPGRRHDGAEAAGGHFDPEAGRHDFLELVRLVEHDDVVLGQHHPTAGQVGTVEVGVDDDDVGAGGPVPGGLGKAGPARGAVEGARAFSGADADHVPGPVRRLEAQIGAVTRGRGLRPGDQGADLVDDALGRRDVTLCRLARVGLPLLCRFGWRVAQLGLDPTRSHLGDPLAAEVVAAPLEDGDVQGGGQAQSRLDQWEVLLGQLVLQRLGRGGHDHFLAAERGGDEIGQRLARPRTGLDDQVGVGHERFGDGPAHLLLLGAVFATRHLGRDLVQPVDGVVAGLTGGRRRWGGTEDVEVIEVLDAVDPVVLHPPIMPAGGDSARPGRPRHARPDGTAGQRSGGVWRS